MTATIPVAVPRKGRPLEAVLDRLATLTGATEVTDEICSTLRYEKAITKGRETAHADVYDRLADYSDLSESTRPEYTLLRDDRGGKPRRIVFDSLTLRHEDDGFELELVGREEPFRALRKHEFALGFDSADLVLEEVVSLGPEPLSTIDDLNARIDPRDTDVRVVAGLGDTVYHTLLGRTEFDESFSREFLRGYEASLCISPRYERLVRAVLGTEVADGVDFRYPDPGVEEEAAIAQTGVGVYLTVTGGTARDHGLVVGERLFPSETVLMENVSESDREAVRRVKALFDGAEIDTELAIQ
jgi:hypothetical protein